MLLSPCDKEPVIWVLLLIDTTNPLSDILLSFKCSLPLLFGILLFVKYNSLPKSLYVSGPTKKWDEVTAPAAVPLCTNINSSCTESYKNEADTCGDDPESIIANPPNLADGLKVFNVIKFVPMFNVDWEIYWIDAEPITVKLFVIIKDPLIVPPDNGK